MNDGSKKQKKTFYPRHCFHIFALKKKQGVWCLLTWTNFSWQVQVFNSRSGCSILAKHLLNSAIIRPNLELKTWPRQLLGSLPLVTALPAENCSTGTIRFWQMPHTGFSPHHLSLLVRVLIWNYFFGTLGPAHRPKLWLWLFPSLLHQVQNISYSLSVLNAKRSKIKSKEGKSYQAMILKRL